MSDSLAVDFVMEALEGAFRKGRPRIINSDQGVQYTSRAWRERIEKTSYKMSSPKF
jgi:transposase InsO family protein